MSMAVKFAHGALLLTAALCLAPLSSAQEEKLPPDITPKPSATAQVANAIAEAQHENRRALILWTEQLLDEDPLKPALRSNRKLSKLLQYEYVRTRVGAKQEGMRAAASRIGIDLKVGFPAVTVVDGAGKLLAHLNLSAWKDAGELDPARIEATLQKYKPEPLDAELLYKEALKQSTQSGKRILVHLGAPW